MNKIKKLATVAILIILSVSSISSFNNNNETINYDTNSSSVENSMLSDNSDIENNTYETTIKIDWQNNYEMPYDITGKIIDGYEDDILICINDDVLHKRLYDNKTSNNIPGFITIGHIHNDKYTLGDASLYEEMTKEETSAYISTRNRIFTAKENTYNVYLKDLYDNSSTGYLKTENPILLRTNADWNVIPWKIKYINYDIDKNAEINPKWADEISAVLNKETGSTYTPAVIRESWSFEYNGKNVSFINASNLWNVEDCGDISEYRYRVDKEYAYSDTDVIYTISAIIVDDKVISYDAHTGILYLKDRKITDEQKREVYYTFQIDELGKTVAVPLYLWPSYGRSILALNVSGYGQGNIPFIGDLDNDGNVDVITMRIYETAMGYDRSILTKNFEKIQEGELYSPGAITSCKYPLHYIEKRDTK